MARIPTDRFDRLRRRVDDWLEKRRDLPVVGVAIRIYIRDRDTAGVVAGSAVAFRLFLFFVPFLLLLAGLAGFLSHLVGLGDLDNAVGASGGVADQIKKAYTQPNESKWVATAVGLFGMLWAGRGLSRVLWAASAVGWGETLAVKARLRVVGAMVGLVCAIGLVTTLLNRVSGEFGAAAAGLSFIPALIAYSVLWLLVEMMLPRRTSDPGALLPGAVLFGITIASMQAVSQFYLPSKLSRASSLYGGLGAAIVTLGWFFFLGRAIVLGNTINFVIHDQFGSISEVVFALPVLRQLPRRSARLRRFFDLGDPPPREASPPAAASPPAEDPPPAEEPPAGRAASTPTRPG